MNLFVGYVFYENGENVRLYRMRIVKTTYEVTQSIETNRPKQTKSAQL